MIDVHVRIDHVADRQLRVTLDRRSQRTPDARRSAGIDHCNAACADHESDVCDVVVSGCVKREQFAGVDENARRDFIDIERGKRIRARDARNQNQHEEYGAASKTSTQPREYAEAKRVRCAHQCVPSAAGFFASPVHVAL